MSSSYKGGFLRDDTTGALVLSVEGTGLAGSGASDRQLLHYVNATGKFAYRDPVFVDITDFGGKADNGTTDHGPIAQSIYDTFGAGTHIRVPAASGGGWYGFAANNAPAVTVNADNCGLFGDGPMSQIRQTGTGGNLLRVNTTGDTTNATMLTGFRLASLVANHQGYATNSQSTGISAAFAIYQVVGPVIEGVTINYARDVGFSVTGCQGPKIHDCHVNEVAWGGAANAFNLGGTSGGSFGTDYAVSNCTITGGCDLAMSCGANRTQRVGVVNCTAKGATNLRTITASISAGTNVMTTDGIGANAFTARDRGRIFRAPTGTAGAYQEYTVTSFDSSTQVHFGATTGPSTAANAVVAGSVQIGLLKSGFVGEGAFGSSRDISITNCHVDTFWTVGLGGYETTINSTVKHERWTYTACSANNGQSGSTGLWFVGQHMKAVGVNVDSFLGAGFLLGGPGDHDEVGHLLVGCTATAAVNATGHGLVVSKSGALTNYLRKVKVVDCDFYGNGYGARGVKLEGHVKQFRMRGGSVSEWAQAGIETVTLSGAAPANAQFREVDVRNNNKSSSGVTSEQSGISLQAGDDLRVRDCRITDDQGLIAPYNLRRTTQAGQGSSFAGGTTFFWTVTALNAAGETVGSNEVSLAPAAAANVTLTWSPVHGATSYKVYRATSSGGQTSGSTLVATVAVSASPSTSPSYVDTGTATTASAAPSSNTTGTATQLHAIYVNTPTRLTARDNDMRGPWQNPLAGLAFPAGSTYEGNIDTDDPYVVTVVLVAGAATVVTSAARLINTITATNVDLTNVTAGGTPGALYVSAAASGASIGQVSFTVTSTNVADTSTVKVRIH